MTAKATTDVEARRLVLGEDLGGVPRLPAARLW
jgi:hypothetical protein